MRKIITYTLVILISAYFSLACYSLSKSDIEELIAYCLYPENNHYPPGLPQFYMLHFRGSENDLELLKSHSGLGFILNSASESRDKIIKYVAFFLEKGFDINSVGFDGFTALHGAILFNHPDDVSFLLKRGADKSVRVGYSRVYGKNEKTNLYGMPPLELATYLSENDGQDRNQIIRMLTKHITGTSIICPTQKTLICINKSAQ
jgi:hypothetical protein